MEMLERVILEPQLPDYLDAGYQVLFDRTGLGAYLKPPTYKAFILHKPTEEEFQDLVNEFWWETTYVAKYLWRDDLFAARYSFDSVIKQQLLVKMLQWYVEIRYGWSLVLGPTGRHLKKYLPSDVWLGVETTFAGPRIDESWDALFSTTELFRRVAIEVADNLEYRYPHDLDENVTDYLARIRSMEEE
jgi:aminoglycoside 6-adenylyltransferase